MTDSDSRVRVLWLIKGLGPGGAERLLHSAARVADHDRFAYEAAYVLAWKSALVPDLEREGVTVHCLDGKRRVESRWPSRLRRLLKEQRYDIVHIHSPLVGGLARAVARTLPAVARPLLVSTEHNHWPSYRLGTRLANAALYGGDAARWAVSEDVRRSIWPIYRDRVDVAVHGLVLDDVRRDEAARAVLRREFGIADHEVVVGTVANFRAQKAYPDLLQAARMVLDADQHVRFIAVGQGPLEAEIRALHNQLGLGDRFQLLGQRDDVLRVLNACDIFTLASMYEGFPVAVMEALAAGLPLVATAVGGIPGTVEDGVQGRIVPPGEPRVLADRIIELAQDTALRERMSVAAKAAGAQFDIRRAVRIIEDKYASLVTEHRRLPMPAGR